MTVLKGKIRFDKEACTGCLACMVACMDAHCQDGDEEAVSRRRIRKVTDEGAQFQKNICIGCIHCGLCISRCPQGALYREETAGLVLLRRELCSGCGNCAAVCPVQAIFFDKDHKGVKCDGCIGYRREGRAPACVKACAVHALELEPE